MIHRNESAQQDTPPLKAAKQATIVTPALLRQISGSSALAHLAEAARFARELCRDPWDFAVEVGTLRELGLTNNDLRCLVCMGLVEHKQETTAIGDTCRVFQPDRPLCFSDNACFVLSEEGFEYVSGILASRNGVHEAGDSGSPPPVRSPVSVGYGPRPATRERVAQAPHLLPASVPAGQNGLGKDLIPKWDGQRQELRLRDIVVKQFKVPAINQERILAAFEEEGWPVLIDDPLPPHPGQDPKRRLHDTINSLNRNQKHALLRFLGDGKGEGVRWEFANEPPSSASAG